MLNSLPHEADAVSDDAAHHQLDACGRFVLVERIGAGGMATVHRAIQRGEGGVERELVVKRILPQLASEQQFVKMFIEEAKLGAHLNHPNIVQIFDLGEHDDGYFMAMEYVEGVSLLRILRSHEAENLLRPAIAAYIVFQICQGLDYAHGLTLEDGRRLCLVHRDVSPANVMVSTHGYVKLLDFGIAKAVGAIEREETRTGTLKGKLAYMSPEQVEGEPLTPRSDIFVTGILLWEALTGRRLFKGSSDYQTLCNVVGAKAPPPSSLRPEIPTAIDEICLRALRRKPEERYQSAEEMADEIEQRVLTAEPIGPRQIAALVDRVRNAPCPNSASAGPLEEARAEQEVDWRQELDVDTVPDAPDVRRAASRAIKSVAKQRRSSWLWTAAAFFGGAMVATTIMVGILVAAGIISFH